MTRKIILGLWWLTLAASLAILLASLPGYLVMGTTADAPTEFATWARISAWLGVALSLSAAGLSIGLACLLFWRKRGDAMGLFLSFFLLMNGIIFCGPVERAVEYWLPQLPYLGLQLEGIFFSIPALVLILIFPNGHFVPRWSRVLVLFAGVLTLLGLMLDPVESVKLNTFRAQVLSGMLYSFLVLALGIQVHRYRKLYTPLERQQTKWVAYGTLLLLVLLALVALPYYYLLNLPPGTPIPWWAPLASPIWWLSLNILPISFTMAILRSHLWETDILIRRTVTYSLLTLTLAFIYFGSVILLQRIFSWLTGVSENEAITVISTLVIAALFVPLRNRIQNAIDKRFNRRKYNAQQVLQKFGETVRDETDIDRLTAELVNVVNETMQPKSVSVWLKRAKDRGRRTKQEHEHSE